jgi:hypothetical protein
MVKSSKFKIGDLVVQRNADFNESYFMICRVVGIEYVDELSDMWLDGYDEEPYYIYEVEIAYFKDFADSYLEQGDVVCFEEYDIVSLQEYLTTRVTIQDYIDYKLNNKEIY